MKYCLITFRSVTPAQRAEQLLQRFGIGCRIQRTPRWMEKQGCGYSLRVSYTDADQCAELLRQREIPFRKIYTLNEEGRFEELRL